MSTTRPTTATHEEIVRRYLLAIPARDAVAAEVTGKDNGAAASTLPHWPDRAVS
jgi:hypothetical protein